MQFNSGDAEPKGWSDAEVDQLLADTAAIRLEVADIDQQLMNIEYLNNYTNSLIIVSITAIYGIVFLASIKLGWMISPYFVPAPKDIAP